MTPCSRMRSSVAVTAGSSRGAPGAGDPLPPFGDGLSARRQSTRSPAPARLDTTRNDRRLLVVPMLTCSSLDDSRAESRTFFRLAPLAARSSMQALGLSIHVPERALKEDGTRARRTRLRLRSRCKLHRMCFAPSECPWFGSVLRCQLRGVLPQRAGVGREPPSERWESGPR
jgi:hypothetical protein